MGELLDQIASLAGGIRLGEVGREIEGAAHERAAAGPNRADGDRRRDVRFADAGRPNEQHAVVGLDKPRARQFDDLGFRDLRIEVPVEVGERLHDRDAGLFQAAREEAIGASGELVLDEQFQKLEMRKRRSFGLRDAPGEGVDHAGQPQVTKTGRELCIHSKKSSKVYWVIGRIAGSSVARARVGRTGGVRSTSWRMV